MEKMTASAFLRVEGGMSKRESISEKEEVDLRKREEVNHEVVERRKEERVRARR